MVILRAQVCCERMSYLAIERLRFVVSERFDSFYCLGFGFSLSVPVHEVYIYSLEEILLCFVSTGVCAMHA